MSDFKKLWGSETKTQAQLELIHAEITKNESTCKVVSTRCQAVPKMLP